MTCCPHGYVCNAATKMCDPAASSNDEKKKKDALFIQSLPAPPNPLCPDNSSTCPKHNTCCATQTVGVYGCCPLENVRIVGNMLSFVIR